MKKYEPMSVVIVLNPSLVQLIDEDGITRSVRRKLSLAVIEEVNQQIANLMELGVKK